MFLKDIRKCIKNSGYCSNITKYKFGFFANSTIQKAQKDIGASNLVKEQVLPS